MSLFREFFLKNFVLKGVSVLLALLLWNQVTSQESVQRTVSAPIVFRDMPRGLEISNEHPTSVDVTLRTNRAGATTEGVTAVIDMKSAEAGMNLVNLTEQDIARASGVDVLNITPARLRLFLEPTGNKRVEVVPEVRGEPAEGYEVSRIQVIPPDVLVSGPESHVEKVTTGSTGPIDVSDRSAPFSQTVFVDLEDSRLRIEGQANVNVVVMIEEKRRERVIRGLPVVTVPEHIHTRLYTQKVTVRGTVPISFEEDLQRDLFRAIVDVSTLEAGSDAVDLPVQVIIPEEYRGTFRPTTVEPEAVRVRRTR